LSVATQGFCPLGWTYFGVRSPIAYSSIFLKLTQLCIAELGRVLRRGSFAKIQMAHKAGLRSTYWRTRRNYADSGHFCVPSCTLASMRDIFEKKIGPSSLIAEAFRGLGLLAEDRSYVSAKAKTLITISILLKNLSIFVRPMIHLADSVYVVSTKR